MTAKQSKQPTATKPKATVPSVPAAATAKPEKKGVSPDFGSMTIAQLLEAEVSLKNELVSRKREAKRELMKEIQAKAKAAGISLSDLMGSGKLKTEPVIKYRNPTNPKQTWGGLGKRPDWLKAELNAGKTLQDLAAY
jgi:DNA-binding protein H-NS